MTIEHLVRVYSVRSRDLCNAGARLQRQLHNLKLLRSRPPSSNDRNSLPTRPPCANLHARHSGQPEGRGRTLTLHGPILDFFTFYVDLWLANRIGVLQKPVSAVSACAKLIFSHNSRKEGTIVPLHSRQRLHLSDTTLSRSICRSLLR